MIQPISDLHCDTAMEIALGADLNDPALEVNLPALRKGGVLLQVFAFYIPPAIPAGHRFRLVSEMIEGFRRQIEPFFDDLRVATTADQVLENARAGRVSAILAVENGNAIENDLHNLEKFYRMDVRLLTIVHAKSNDWVISSGDNHPAFNGLTDFGCEVIREMNNLGMIIDLSHSHDLTVDRVLNLTQKPVIASHSCVHALCPVARNLKDEWISGIAESGGVIGINLYPGFLDAVYSHEAFSRGGDLFAELSRMEKQAGTDMAEIVRLFREFKRSYQQLISNEGVGLDRVVDHIDYIVSRFGDQVVTFGSDFDGLPALPAGVRDCSSFADLRQSLVSQGYSASQMQNICWDNFLRVFRSCCG